MRWLDRGGALEGARRSSWSVRARSLARHGMGTTLTSTDDSCVSAVRRINVQQTANPDHSPGRLT